MRLKPKDFMKLLIRPVIVVSTISKEGVSNAAPFSFNSPVSFSPPIIAIFSNPKHDTWRNIKENKEFVVNIIGEEFGPLMKILEKDYPYGVSEIKEANLTEEPSRKIRPPRIKEAFAWLECKMIHSAVLGDHVLIAGEIIEAEVKSEVFDKVVLLEKAKPLCHISGEYFSTPLTVSKFERA
jgi:flavin reductase (DIM6/NTAB) family NADH-FMN oxidoreductase RutF